ncbi:MAG: VF530 family protein [Candidatus Omnitrophica bacterium]|nr:VF530 family protein [Candidatus Omnitrophota bacterium]
MPDIKSKDPLEGVTLKMILTDLEQWYGWQVLAENITIRCFMFDPSISSSLKFLRKTPWARKKVEDFYRKTLRQRNVNKK